MVLSAILSRESPHSNMKNVASQHQISSSLSEKAHHLVLVSLPPENILHVASYLSISEVRTLATSNHVFRSTLMCSAGGNSDIWMKVMRQHFSNVLPSNKVKFVDDLHLPIPGLTREEDDEYGKKNNSNNKVNLSLLACLLPTSYPQQIDPKTTHPHTTSFQSYDMMIDIDTNTNTTILSSQNKDATATASSTSSRHEVVVPVVQFVGKAGTGNQCIRSDQPFPKYCKKVKGSATISSRTDKSLGRVSNRRTSSSRSTVGRKTTLNARRSTLVSKFKGCLDKLLRYGMKNDNLRPFVVPTIISTNNTQDEEVDGSTITAVDVTPKLVAYFEVTLIKQHDVQQADDENSAHLTKQLNTEDQEEEEEDSESTGQQPHAQPNQHQHHECVAIGLTTRSFPLTKRLPGWDVSSYGYHSDDGSLFNATHSVLSSAPTYGPGDTVGCGLDYSTRHIFFVKNGECLGYAFDKKVEKEVLDKGLYPTIGIDKDCPVYVNFGERPFKFDLRGFAGCQ